MFAQRLHTDACFIFESLLLFGENGRRNEKEIELKKRKMRVGKNWVIQIRMMMFERTNATARNLQRRIEMNIFNKNINTNNAEAMWKIYDFDAE